MADEYYTLRISIHRVLETYQVELSHQDPTSQAQVAPTRGAAAFDLDALQRLHPRHADYGQALTQQLLSDPDLTQRFVQVDTAAQAAGCFLRVLVCIDPSAQELQSLRWELLRHPKTSAALGTSERILLSRFMVSRDWRPVTLRARTELHALIAISAPTPESLARAKLAPVDFEGEVTRVRRALPDIAVRVLGGPDDPCTLDRLLDALRRGVDILYFVGHGMIGRRTGTPALVLQDETGASTIVTGEDLTSAIAELQRGPRLVVLASCQSAGDGDRPGASSSTTAQATLAGRLANAGVPGVIAMQGFITMATIETFAPAFFAELLVDGQIDRALAVARAKVRDRDDAWMPALFSRLTEGRLWYTPGFRGKQGQEVWRRLLLPVANGKVVPIIGPRLNEAAHGTSHQTAQRLAGATHYPMASHEHDDLPRVTGYMSVKESRYNVLQAYQNQLLDDLVAQHRGWLPPEEIPPHNPRPKLGKLLALVGDHLRHDADDPHRILAELRAPLYVTTNFDPLLERALRAADRPPQQVLTRWRYRKAPRSADEQPIAEPTVNAPLVYHVFGAFGSTQDDGLVLTADDYFDFLIHTASDKLIPAEVESALVDNSLLFLGFRLTDWHFQVLFRLMMNLPGRERLKQYCHVAVQLDPDLQSMADVEGAKAFLSEYFGKEANIDIFWGSSQEFLTALRDELARAGDLGHDDDAPAQEDDDEWDF
ncbi:CHAT domain-containing protein [Paraliomyxa miuraensis]|uniref:CHAT domain-containing protein n=1 Tax=Paraliomyxa miuraensis TaxID=376150 RepID=UPI002252D5C8|nr:CHAT domain-containing protein [Paraliomyxa miuraensis]MCX4240773.1 CHAT domain-containing protein [Paraliomyxa miuraensis]